MTPEEKDLLEKTYALTQENNAMLVKMRKSAKTTLILRWVYWGIIILLTIISLYFASPFLQSFGIGFGGGNPTTYANEIKSLTQ